MSFTYYRKFDSPEAGARRSARLKGKVPKTAQEKATARLTQTAKKRKRVVKTDGSVIREDKKPRRSSKTPPKKKSSPIKEKPAIEKEEKKEERKGEEIEDKMDLEEAPSREKVVAQTPRKSPQATVAKKRPAAAPAVADGKILLKRRRVAPLENDDTITTDLFAARVQRALDEVTEKAQGDTLQKDKLAAFVKSFLQSHGEFLPAEKLPPNPRSVIFAATEEKQILYRDRLQSKIEELKTQLESQDKPLPEDEVVDIAPSPSLPASYFSSGSDRESTIESIVTDSTGAVIEGLESLKQDLDEPLQTLVLQSYELLTRVQQMAHLNQHVDRYFSKVAGLLREEEIGESVPLTLSSTAAPTQ
eukprot:TRINITY_DN7841_c0_g1_i1.p1 TRINITY_DN7841_c0_g1~~TRINITY_DN7841_c0_g1_i1.p1  ORF type:complete len:391 (+),score=106.07 TRINITY_DN7841_c0_g1_i1:95-1174(+)